MFGRRDRIWDFETWLIVGLWCHLNWLFSKLIIRVWRIWKFWIAVCNLHESDFTSDFFSADSAEDWGLSWVLRFRKCTRQLNWDLRADCWPLSVSETQTEETEAERTKIVVNKQRSEIRINPFLSKFRKGVWGGTLNCPVLYVYHGKKIYSFCSDTRCLKITLLT